MFWEHFNSSNIFKTSKIENIAKFNTKIDKAPQICHITYKILCKERNLTLEDVVSSLQLQQQED
jgi:hypothetical protein